MIIRADYDDTTVNVLLDVDLSSFPK